jgi:hypothetical protein
VSSNRLDNLIACCKQYQLLATAAGPLYHLTNTEYKIGDQVHPTYRSTNNKAEEFLEKIRAEKYANRPSRIGCVFVSEAKSIPAWQNFMKRKYIYEVSCAGNAFQTDGELFTEVDFAVRDLNNLAKYGPDPDGETEEELLQNATERAGYYWDGVEGARLSEIIVQGIVQVTKILYIGK